MKKAKILLTTVTMVTIASGVLAFKAQKFTDKALYTYDFVSGACNFVTLCTTGTGASVSNGTLISTGSGVPGNGACNVAIVNYNPVE